MDHAQCLLARLLAGLQPPCIRDLSECLEKNSYGDTKGITALLLVESVGRLKFKIQTVDL